MHIYIYIQQFLGFARNSTTQRQSYYRHHRHHHHHHHHQSGNTCWLVTLHLLKCHSCQSFVQLKLTRIQAAQLEEPFFYWSHPSSAIHSRRRVARDRGGTAVIEATFQTPWSLKRWEQQVNWNNNLSWNTKVSLRPLRNVSTREGRRANRTQRIECMKRSASYRMLEVQNLVQTKTKARVKIWHCFNLTLHVTKNRLQESSSPWPEWSSPCRPNGSPLQSVFCWSFHGGEISALPGIILFQLPKFCWRIVETNDHFKDFYFHYLMMENWL